MKKNSIGIIGGGVWGSALAKILMNNEILIYARDSKVVSSINKFKINPKLKYATFNDNVSATSNLQDLKKSEYLIVALPTNEVREVLSAFKNIEINQQIIIGSKGIEISSKKFLYDVIQEVLNTQNISILSGPCFSVEVAQNLPTAVTLATLNRKTFDEINSLFSHRNLRLYFSNDILGCQLGGAIKNVYAIASGITLGLNLGENAKSSLITRSFAEMTRFAKFINAEPSTLYGLSGLGDLILTCSSLKSRNTSFGQLISGHQRIDISEHLKTQDTTEGYYTVQAVYEIAKENKIDMPIATAVYNILFNKSPISDEIANLLNRPVTSEIF